MPVPFRKRRHDVTKSNMNKVSYITQTSAEVTSYGFSPAVVWRIITPQIPLHLITSSDYVFCYFFDWEIPRAEITEAKTKCLIFYLFEMKINNTEPFENYLDISPLNSKWMFWKVSSNKSAVCTCRNPPPGVDCTEETLNGAHRERYLCQNQLYVTVCIYFLSPCDHKNTAAHNRNCLFSAVISLLATYLDSLSCLKNTLSREHIITVEITSDFAAWTAPPLSLSLYLKVIKIILPPILPPPISGSLWLSQFCFIKSKSFAVFSV